MVSKELLNDVKAIVIQSGNEILKFYGKDVDVKNKFNQSPVTQADIVSERIVFDGLKKYGYPFLSEETEDDFNRLRANRIWLVDPLDGTKDFLQQTGDFTIMVGLVENGESVLGCVYKPDEKILYYGVQGQGAFKEVDGGKAEAIKVSNRKEYPQMKMLVSRNHILPYEKGFAKRNGIAEMITSGSAGLKICKIAEGSADIYINSSDRTYEWDICAADVIIREAGGSIETLEGERIFFNKQDIRNLEGFLVRN